MSCGMTSSLTTASKRRGLARALQAGVNRVLRKPYRMTEIAETLAGFFSMPK